MGLAEHAPVELHEGVRADDGGVGVGFGGFEGFPGGKADDLFAERLLGVEGFVDVGGTDLKAV